MYSVPAVECVLSPRCIRPTKLGQESTRRMNCVECSSDAKNAIDEVVTRGYYGALPLSYGAEKSLEF